MIFNINVLKNFKIVELTFCVISFLIAFVLIVPVFASSNSFDKVPLYSGDLTPSGVSSNGISVCISNGRTIYLISRDDQTYMAWINNTNKLFVATPEFHGSTLWIVWSDGHSVFGSNYNADDIYHDNNGYYYSITIGGTKSEGIASFDTLDEAKSAFAGFDPNQPDGSTINYSLPAGNIAIIETDSSYSYVNLSTTMPLQSTSFASNPWPNTSQRIGYYSTLPQTLNPNSMGNVIEWERNGNTTLFNVTTNAKYNPSVVSTFKYVVIANPYYYPANDMEDRQFTNGAINISMDGVVNITVKSLTATINTQTGETENNYNGDEWTGDVDVNTGDIIWTDNNGNSNAPTNGGNLSDPSITGFESWLKGILNNIVNIFEPAHDAISTLSGAVSNFASWMYALYIWLPSPILSLLTSAISLAIVIGIIKVFI